MAVLFQDDVSNYNESFNFGIENLIFIYYYNTM